MRIAIFGGSFNPPHVGHVEAARKALADLAADRLLVIPAAKPPHKEAAVGSPDASDRLNLTRLAMAELPNAEVSDMEIRRGGTSYTVDTLLELRAQYSDDELYLLIGTDMLLSFETWKDYQQVFKLATLAVFARAPGEDEAISQMSRKLQSEYGAKIIKIPLTPTEASSTELRRILPLRDGDELLPDAVYSEIIKRRYYGAKPNLRWLRDKSQAYLDAKRIPHVLGCEQEAVRLAKHWGADPGLAAEAGILHDITKRRDREGQLILCREYGIMTDDDERSNTKLLHSKTGAALARDLFGIPDEVFSAIFWHTTGRECMTLLDEIIYMADYIEPNRDFDGVQELRRLAYDSIHKAVLMGIEMTVSDLSDHGINPHDNSLKAAQWLKQIISQ